MPRSRLTLLVTGLLLSLVVLYIYTGEDSELTDRIKISDKLEGNSIAALLPSNRTKLARQKNHLERRRNSSPDNNLTDIEIQEMLNDSLFSKTKEVPPELRQKNPTLDPLIRKDLDSLALINTSGAQPSLRFDSSNNILSIAGDFLLQSQDGTNAAKSAGVISLIEGHRSLTGFGDNEVASITKDIIENDRGEAIIRLDRIYKNLPVWGRQLVVIEKNGSVVSITGKFRGITNNIDVSARLNDAQLEDLVSREFEEYGPSYASIKSVNRGIFIKSRIPIYSYRVIVEASLGRQWELYFSPSTGFLVAKLPLFYETSTSSTGTDLMGETRSFNSEFEDNEYFLVDQSFPQGSYSVVAELDEEGSVQYVASSSANSGWDAAGVSAIYNSKQTHDYFFNTHGRSSYDGNGAKLISIVNATDEGEPWFQATWNGSFMTYGTGDDGSKNLAIALDVAGHEFSHAVVQFTSNLRYQNQSGALNESFADFFGAMIDRDDWYIGEDILNPYGPYDYLRDMMNPSSTGQPGHMNNFMNLPNTDDGDHGGVHFNSGIQNRALYLLAEGLTSEGLGKSVGKAKSERLAYATLQKLTADAEFIDSANTMMLEAQSIYGSSSAEYQSVSDAWEAVGVTTSVVVTEGGADDMALTTGDDVLAYLYPKDGAIENLWDEEYDIYVTVINQPFSGHVSSTEIGPINDFPAAGSQPSLHTDESNNLFAAYVGADGKARWTYVANTAEDTEILDNTDVNSIASSPSGDVFGVVLNGGKTIYIYNFADGAWEAITVEGPSYSTDGEGASVEYVDAINFDVTGQKIIFDFKMCTPVPEAECQGLWSIGIYDLGTKNFEYPFSSSNIYVDLGYPRFSNTRNDVITFDYQDWTNYEAEGKAVSRSIIYDLSSRETIGAYETNGGETRAGSFGIPSFIGEDVALAIQSQGDDYTQLYQVSLGENYNYIADSIQWLVPYNSGFGSAHRNAYKNITAKLESDKPNADIGAHLSGSIISTDFTLSNSGNRELAITEISLNSSSMSTTLTNRVLLPGESATFAFKMDTNGAELGLFSGTISIKHSGDNATLNLGLSGYIDSDTDEDGILNSVDDDDDNDDVLDVDDAFPMDASESADTDGDGVGDNADAFPEDATEVLDTDDDGTGDNRDAFPEDSSESLDTDLDGLGNNADTDDDNDGVQDGDDAFPLDSGESSDYDSDGIGNNADTDDDNDSVLDGNDAFPLDALESLDTDDDGIGNNADTDDDGDGVPDLQDAFPLKNTETTDSDGDGIGDNDEERAELVASDILSQKMISYAGSVAASFIDDIEDDFAGESDDWTLARGASVSLSVACSNGGGYDAVVTRTDWQVLTISLDIENCVDTNLMTTNGSATLTYDDALWDQQTPREQHPFIFSFSNLSIQDRVSKRFDYTGSLYCDSHYNSAAESWTYSVEGDSRVYEGRWGSVFDDLGEVYWNVNSSLLIDESGNTDFYIARYLTNCDFLNVQVKEGTKNHTILDVQYISQSNGSGYKISEDTRSEKLEKVKNKEVFLKERYTPETGWTTELYSRYGRNSSVRLSGKGDYSVNVYSSIIPTYYWARREGIDNIIFQEVDQFSDFEWVYLDETTDTIFSVNSELDWNSVWDFENDGIKEVISEPWAISRFYSATECNRFLRFGEWTVVAQSPKSESPPPCYFNTGFDIYDGEIWYQDINLDGLNELFTLDDDGDGVTDAEDNCQAVVNLNQIDTDNDSVGNACDKDDDGDGTPDLSDAFPLDNSETLDTDGDGVGNNSDWAPYDFDESADSDSDGVGDNADAFPNDPTEILDMDGDGIGDNSDSDIDGDGALNSDDPYPLNGEYSADTDNDGMPDAWETKYGLDPNDASDATSDRDNDGVTALDEFLAGTIPSGSLDIDGNEDYDALTDGLLLLRGMFGLDGSALVTGTIASDAAYTESVDIESRIATLGELADIDGNGDIDALTDGLLTLRYLFGLQGDTLINGVVASDATRKTAEEIEAHLEILMPAL